MLDNISDEYIPIVESLERECDEIDAAIIHKAASEQPDMLQYDRLYQPSAKQAHGNVLTHVTWTRCLWRRGLRRRIWEARRSASYLHRRVNQMLDVMKKVTTINERQGGLKIHKDTLYYFQDILDHIIDMEQRILSLQESLSRSQGNYFAKISIDVTAASNRMSQIMKQVRAK